MKTLNATINMRKFTGIRKSVNYLEIINEVTMFNVNVLQHSKIGNNIPILLV